ncbi:MAG: hypothetical protein OXT65_12520 [Alphaproteobacteria bacterium]|nr:hypothetical protein [Alphaproteobacteria bacterium]
MTCLKRNVFDKAVKGPFALAGAGRNPDHRRLRGALAIGGIALALAGAVHLQDDTRPALDGAADILGGVSLLCIARFTPSGLRVRRRDFGPGV